MKLNKNSLFLVGDVVQLRDKSLFTVEKFIWMQSRGSFFYTLKNVSNPEDFKYYYQTTMENETVLYKQADLNFIEDIGESVSFNPFEKQPAKVVNFEVYRQLRLKGEF